MKKFAAVEDPISGEVQARNVSVGLQSLDEVDLREVFKLRAVVMKSVLPFHARKAMKLACINPSCNEQFRINRRAVDSPFAFEFFGIVIFIRHWTCEVHFFNSNHTI